MNDLKRIAHDLEAEALDYHGHAHDYLVDAAHALLGAADRIKELETALRSILLEDSDKSELNILKDRIIARAALERKRDE